MAEVCPPLIVENCEECFLLEFTDCDTIQINAGVTPSTLFFLFVEDHFDKQYLVQVLTDGNGDFIINGGLFPAGFFNSYGGQYEIILATDDQGVNIVPMNIGAYGAPFNCALLSFDIAANLVCCNDPVDIDDGIRIVRSFFPDASNLAYTFTVTADEAATYQAPAVLTNVATLTFLVNAAPVTLPFTVVAGDTLAHTITRTAPGDADVKIQGNV